MTTTRNVHGEHKKGGLFETRGWSRYPLQTMRDTYDIYKTNDDIVRYDRESLREGIFTENMFVRRNF